MTKKSLIGWILFGVLAIVSLVFLISNLYSEESHPGDYSVEIEGSAMKTLSVQEVADLWGIDSEQLLQEIITEFELTGNYTTKTTLEEMRTEYAFSPALIKTIAEEIKSGETNE